MVWFKHKKVADEVSGEQAARDFFEHNYVKVGEEKDGRHILQPVNKVGIDQPTYWGTCMYNLSELQYRTLN